MNYGLQFQYVRNVYLLVSLRYGIPTIRCAATGGAGREGYVPHL